MRNKVICILTLTILASVFLHSCQSESELNYARYFVNGKGVYEKHCQNCHAADGAGLGMLIPPLTDTLFLKENKNQLSCIIKYGLNGKISVNGKIYDGRMPAERHLSDIEIGAVITYITNSFGNKQGLHDVNDVARDLGACK